MRVAGLVLLVVFASRTHAESPTIHTWRSQDGRVIEGGFGGIDGDGKSITVLIPRVVPLSALDDDSLALAKSMARGKESMPAVDDEKIDEPAVAPLADDFIPLFDRDHCDSAMWRTLSERDQTELVGGLVYLASQSVEASGKLVESVATPKRLNDVVRYARDEIDKLARTVDDQTQTIEDLFRQWAGSQKWFRRDAAAEDVSIRQVVEGVAFFDIVKLAFDKRYPKITGKVRNERDRKLTLGTFHCNWFEGDSLVGVTPIFVGDLEPGQVRSFQAVLAPDAKVTDSAKLRTEITSVHILFSDE
ncbi:FxLYD domain-containing protein [Novipirellula caenicola]|uniref:SLA1 homology domain-containing protein n=1 Tax=Novipirellula caenicola TaxID=1536901 RepID=A0ABP9VZL0_9BACT